MQTTKCTIRTWLSGRGTSILFACIVGLWCAIFKTAYGQEVDGTNAPSRLLSGPRVAETSAAATARKQQVAERRAGTMVIAHRGSSEFAHENTLEAYRATFELGADGNEIDIRQTSDGVLVCFHDDMLDRLSDGWGALHDLTWEQVQKLTLRFPDRYGGESRIPTLAEVLELHRNHSGLLHLDIKQPGIDGAIARQLEAFDVWEHVLFCNGDNGGVILKDPRVRLSRYKGGLYEDRSEVFPDLIDGVLKKEGNAVIVDDPRGVVRRLGRTRKLLSKSPVRSLSGRPLELASIDPLERRTLFAKLAVPEVQSQIPKSDLEKEELAKEIRERAKAARQLQKLFVDSGNTKPVSPLTSAEHETLERLVRHRTLHPFWMWHGLDGACALEVLLTSPDSSSKSSVDVARFVLFRDDPALALVANPEFKTPRSWTDYRVKMVIFPALSQNRSKAAAQLCRDYLRLTESETKAVGPDQFREAARALFEISPTRETALELLEHPRVVVQGETVLGLLRNVKSASTTGNPTTYDWARTVLKEKAPIALEYVVEFKE